LRDGGWVRTPAIERAFRTVPHHRLLREFARWDAETSRPIPVAYEPDQPDDDALRMIYSDQALGTRFRGGMPTSLSSQPSVMAQMLEALAVGPGMRVLVIGTGTGYNAALLAEIVGARGLVVTVDRDAGVADGAREALQNAGYDRVRVLARDGADGAPEASPFDGVVVTVGCPDVAPAWRAARGRWPAGGPARARRAAPAGLARPARQAA
jgi:protein-L-isoaspartate(D-aspartate) O-methyltransferase